MRDGFRPQRDWRLGKTVCYRSNMVTDSHFMIFVIVGNLSLSLIRTLRTKLGFTDQSGFLLRYAFVLFLLHLPRDLFRRRLLLV